MTTPNLKKKEKRKDFLFFSFVGGWVGGGVEAGIGGGAGVSAFFDEESKCEKKLGVGGVGGGGGEGV